MTHKQTLVLVGVLITAFALTVGAGTATAQPSATEEFNVTFGGADSDNATSVVQTSDGGFALAGDTGSFGSGDQDAWLIKTGANGNKQFNKTFGGPGENKIRSVVQTSDGGFALAGDTRSSSPGPIPALPDAWLIKTDANGNVEFSETFGGQGPDGAVSVVQTSDGGFALAGTTVSFGSGASDPWLIKTDENGNEEFSETFGGQDTDTGQDVVQTSDGGFALSGTFESSSGSRDPLLVKTDSNGNEQFSKTFGMSGDSIAFSVAQTSDGGFALSTGPPVPVPPGGGEAGLIKTDANANEEFSKTFGGSDTDRAGSVVQTSDGGFALSASTQSFGSGDFDAWLIKTDSNGNAETNETFGGSATDRAASVIQTSDGGFALAGSTESFGAGGKDAWLIKVSGEDGSAPPNLEVSIDSTNSPVTEGETLTVTGTIENTGGRQDTQTITATASGFGSITRTVTLGAGQSTTETVSIPTSQGDAGTSTVTVESENDTATTTVVVEPDDGGGEGNATVESSDVRVGSTGETGESAITVDAENGMSIARLNVSVDTSVAEIQSVSEGADVDSSQPAQTFNVIDQTADSVRIEYSNLQAQASPIQDFELARVELEAQTDDGDTPIQILTDELRDGNTDSYGTVNENEGTFSVGAALFEEPLPGFSNPPTNTGELDPNLYEDVDGDGDGLDPTQAVNLWTQLVINEQDFDDLTQEQIDALDWNGDGQLTPADAVSLWTEQVLAS